MILSLIIIGISATTWLMYLNHLDVYKRDKHTRAAVFVAFVAGMLSVAPILLLSHLNPFQSISASFGPFLYHYLIVAVPEEGSKFIFLVLAVRLMRSVKEPQDGIIQGAAVGAGFAIVENILYAMRYDEITTLMRSIVSIGGHVVETALAGFFLSVAIYSNLEARDDRAKLLAVGGVFLVAISHALFNASTVWAMWNERLDWGYVLVLMVTLFLAVAAFRRMVERSPYRVYPYTRAKEAVAAIRRGLILNPTSFVLNRRLALYLMALGQYKEALGPIALCRRQTRKKKVFDLLKGVCLLGAGKPDEAFRLIDTAGKSMDKKTKFRMERTLRLAIRDAGLALRVDNILNPRVFTYNPFPKRFVKYGKKHYWKSDSRILREKLEELRDELKKKSDREESDGNAGDSLNRLRSEGAADAPWIPWQNSAR